MRCRATSEHFRGLEARAPRANCARGETPHITSRAGSPRSQGGRRAQRDGAHPIAGWKPALPGGTARAARRRTSNRGLEARAPRANCARRARPNGRGRSPGAPQFLWIGRGAGADVESGACRMPWMFATRKSLPNDGHNFKRAPKLDDEPNSEPRHKARVGSSSLSFLPRPSVSCERVAHSGAS